MIGAVLRASSAFSSLPTVPMTVAPRCFAHCKDEADAARRGVDQDRVAALDA